MKTLDQEKSASRDEWKNRMDTLTDTIKEEKTEKIRKEEQAKEIAKKAKEAIARYDVAGEYTKIENVDGLIKIRVCSNPKLWLADKGAFIGVGKGLGEAAKFGQAAAESALGLTPGLGILVFTAKTIIKLNPFSLSVRSLKIAVDILQLRKRPSKGVFKSQIIN